MRTINGLWPTKLRARHASWLLLIIAISSAAATAPLSTSNRREKLLRMSRILAEELAELDALAELGALEGRLADEDGRPQAPSGPAVLELANVDSDDEISPSQPVGASPSSAPASDAPTVPLKRTKWKRSISELHGEQFSGTMMPYPMPTRMGGVASYTAGRHFSSRRHHQPVLKFKKRNGSDTELQSTKQPAASTQPKAAKTSSRSMDAPMAQRTATTATSKVVATPTSTSKNNGSSNRRETTRAIKERLRRLRSAQRAEKHTKNAAEKAESPLVTEKVPESSKDIADERVLAVTTENATLLQRTGSSAKPDAGAQQRESRIVSTRGDRHMATTSATLRQKYGGLTVWSWILIISGAVCAGVAVGMLPAVTHLFDEVVASDPRDRRMSAGPTSMHNRSALQMTIPLASGLTYRAIRRCSDAVALPI